VLLFVIFLHVNVGLFKVFYFDFLLTYLDQIGFKLFASVFALLSYFLPPSGLNVQLICQLIDLVFFLSEKLIFLLDLMILFSKKALHFFLNSR